jgi:hypothetical protein
MDQAKLRILAAETVAAIKAHTQRALAPIVAKLDAHAAVNGELARELAELERRLEALEAKLAEAHIRRVA